MLMIYLTIENCPDRVPSLCSHDCTYYIEEYGCNGELYCGGAKKIKDYCKYSCKNCGKY